MDAHGKPIVLARVIDRGDRVEVIYTCPPELYETVVNRILEVFQLEIADAYTESAIRRACANLYQMLEWLHPFGDGQGRTDLMFLAVLLTTYGLTPAIFDDPYMSTFCASLEKWVDYLEKGEKKWKVEFAEQRELSISNKVV